MATCCLCRSDLSSIQAKKRKKKLYGTGVTSEGARLILADEVQKKFGVGLKEIEETSSDSSYLCRNCDSKLKKIIELEKQAQQLRSELELLISSYHLKPRASGLALVTPGASRLDSIITEKRFEPANNDNTSEQPYLELEIQQVPNTTRLQQETPAESTTRLDSIMCGAKRSGPALSDNTSKHPHLEPEIQQLSNTACLQQETLAESAMTHQSPDVSVIINYPSGSKMFSVQTPSRKAGVKHYARRCYHAVAATTMKSEATSDKVLREVGLIIKKEMKDLASIENDSILRDTLEAVKHFSWETIIAELQSKVPSLMKLLQCLVKNPKNSKPFIASLACQLLKDSHPQLGLFQRALSVHLYANGTSKNVFRCLNRLNISMSFQGMLNTVKGVSEFHDVEAQYWCESLEKEYLKKQSPTESTQLRLYDVQASEEDLSEQSRATDYLSQMEGLDEDYSTQSKSLHDQVTVCDETELLAYSSSSTNSISSTSPAVSTPSGPAYSPVSDLDMASSESTQESPSEESTVHEALDTDVQMTSFEHSEEVRTRPTWEGLKVVGDNWDLNIHPSFQRNDRLPRSIHYFNSYAVKDRLNLSETSDIPKPSPSAVDPKIYLVSKKEWDSFKDDCIILITRILVQHLDEFKNEASKVTWHIPSKFTKEMSMKSEILPLGVQLQNENQLEQMANILDEIHEKYVPTQPSEGSVSLPDGVTRSYDSTTFHRVLFGGDQLTVARARGAIELRSLHAKPVHRLEGVVPVVEDWHARMTLMKVLWKRFYSKVSVSERGTMYQIRNLLNRSNVPLDPEKNMKAAEDFMLLLLHAHVVAAAKEVLKYEVPESLSVQFVAKSIINTHLLLPDYADGAQVSEDGVTAYARELLTLSLLWHFFHDATKEADGERLLLSWKILLPVFKATNHRNYAKECVLLLWQSSCFSDRMRSQLLWSRCVNTQGKQGANIPCDLHMEHLNRRLKTILRSMGVNLSKEAILKAGRSLYTVQNVCMQFEAETCSSKANRLAHLGRHKMPAFGKDFDMLLHMLVRDNIFQPQEERHHPTFQFRKGLLQHYSCDELQKRIMVTLKGHGLL